MKKLLKWLRWNSANILSASRFLSILIPFEIGGLNVYTTFSIIILLGLTDFLDGWIARKIGNFQGIGMAIDTSADKVMILSVSIWILLEIKNINPKIIEMIILGEVLAAALAGVGIFLAKNKHQRFSRTVKTILKHWKINAPGKLAMVFYFSMGIFIALFVIFPQNETWAYFYLISFWGGLIFRLISIGYYVVDLNNWQKKQNKMP